MFSSDRAEYRKIFFDAWGKHKTQQELTPLEKQIVNLIVMHPEYHAILEDEAHHLTQQFDEANPFLHLSLHLGIREQAATDRPAGIQQIYFTSCNKYKDLHTAEHKMMECLAKILWEANQQDKMPDEAEYLRRLREL